MEIIFIIMILPDKCEVHQILDEKSFVLGLDEIVETFILEKSE